MKKLLLAAAAVLALSSAASAIEVEYYSASLTFAKMVGACYDAAPLGLRNAMMNPTLPRVMVVKDPPTFHRLGQVLKATDTFLKGSNGIKFISGLSFEGNPNVADRFIALLEDNHTFKDGLNEVYTCKVTLHEMVHLYDFPYAGYGRKQPKNVAFAAAFKADVAQTNAWAKAKKTSKDVKERIEFNRSYLNSLEEAFAETAATIMYFHPDSFRFVVMAAIFPRVMTQMRELLVRDLIIPADHVGPIGAPERGAPPTDIVTGKISSR
jgi:hypothetical protein